MCCLRTRYIDCSNYFYYPAATKYYGNTLERAQAVADGNILANRLGIDTFEFFNGMIHFLEDLYNAGLIKEDPEFPLNKIGSREFIKKLLHSIARRKGIGNLLADGSARTADQIKDGWEYCSRYFPAHGSPQHGSVRQYPGVALQWALDSRDPIIDQYPYYRLSVSSQKRPQSFTIPLEYTKMLSNKIFGTEIAIDHSTFEHKPEAIIYAQDRSAVINILVLCDWVYPIIFTYATENRIGDTFLESQLLGAVTGYKLTEKELNQVGERVWNLARAFMVREGRTRDEDTFHESYFSERNGEKAISKSDFEKAKTKYYKLRGWDEEKGWPTREKLYQLNLSDVADDLQTESLLK